MINVWFDILHTPQLNFYIPFIGLLNNDGYKVYVTVLNRGKLPSIAKRELSAFGNVSIDIVGRHRMNKVSVIVEANFLRLIRLFFWAWGKKINVSFSNGSHIGIIGSAFGIKSFEFEDDPQASDYRLMVKFATKNHSLLYELPADYKLLPKDNLLPALKEWAYLNPRTFQPSLSALEPYSLEAHSYIFVREVSVGTLNYAGQSPDSILQIADKFPKDVKIVLSLEKKDKRDLYPSDWILLQEPVEDIHSLIYYSCGLISSGDSMAREAALMGIPSYYLGIRYDMPANLAASKVATLQNRKTMEVEDWLNMIVDGKNSVAERQQVVREEIDDKFMDINEYMYSLVKQEEAK